MKSIPTVKPALLGFLLAGAVMAGCNSPQGKSEQAEVNHDPLIDQMNTAETSIEESVHRLEDKAKELKKAMEELDTTNVIN